MQRAHQQAEQGHAACLPKLEQGHLLRGKESNASHFRAVRGTKSLFVLTFPSSKRWT